MGCGGGATKEGASVPEWVTLNLALVVLIPAPSKTGFQPMKV